MIKDLSINLLKNFAPICAVGAAAYYYKRNENDKAQPFKTMFIQRTFEVLTYSFLSKQITNTSLRFTCSYVASLFLTRAFSNGYKTGENIVKYSAISILSESALRVITGKKFLGEFFAPRLIKVLVELKLVK